MLYQWSHRVAVDTWPALWLHTLDSERPCQWVGQKTATRWRNWARSYHRTLLNSYAGCPITTASDFCASWTAVLTVRVHVIDGCLLVSKQDNVLMLVLGVNDDQEIDRLNRPNPRWCGHRRHSIANCSRTVWDKSNGHNGEPIGNCHRSFDRWPLPLQPPIAPNMGIPNALQNQLRDACCRLAKMIDFLCIRRYEPINVAFCQITLALIMFVSLNAIQCCFDVMMPVFGVNNDHLVDTLNWREGILWQCGTPVYSQVMLYVCQLWTKNAIKSFLGGLGLLTICNVPNLLLCLNI